MPQKREKGKIAHSEWRNITTRYESGESIAQIGRDYGCTGPAIRYILRKSGTLVGNEPASGKPSMGRAQEHRSETPRASALIEAKHPRLESVQAEKEGARTVAPKAYRGLMSDEVLKRVTGDIALFLVALDQAANSDPASVNALRTATDSLMRSIARIRIELDRAAWSQLRQDKRSPDYIGA